METFLEALVLEGAKIFIRVFLVPHDQLVSALIAQDVDAVGQSLAALDNLTFEKDLLFRNGEGFLFDFDHLDPFQAADEEVMIPAIDDVQDVAHVKLCVRLGHVDFVVVAVGAPLIREEDYLEVAVRLPAEDDAVVEMEQLTDIILHFNCVELFQGGQRQCSKLLIRAYYQGVIDHDAAVGVVFLRRHLNHILELKIMSVDDVCLSVFAPCIYILILFAVVVAEER